MNNPPPLLPEPNEQELFCTWGDQADGSYTNPILPCDYCDIDAIRVGADYYAISSTMQFSPGIVILHSRDLVNWRILGHAVADLTQISPKLNWDAMGEHYARAIWAPAIRYHNERFWIYFCTPDEGLFVTSAAQAAGPWSDLHQLFDAPGWDDCCPFWDDDGQGYLVLTHFADNYKNYLYRLSDDGLHLLDSKPVFLHEGLGREASKLFKYNDLYYHYFSEVRPEGRVPMMARAKQIEGPYEHRQIGHVDIVRDKEPNQGGLIELPDGTWQFVTHHGTGDWEGRMLSLLPVTWVDGWPIVGRIGPDGIGNMLWRAPKPINGHPIMHPQTSDDFMASTLGPQWEWNYQPRADKWSLTERPGYLRLHAFAPLRAGQFPLAGNTLSQRVFRSPHNQVTIKLDLRGMQVGQRAGLCHFSRSYCLFGITQQGDQRILHSEIDGVHGEQLSFAADYVWLRATWSIDGESHYSYSHDGQVFQPYSQTYQLRWGHYRGARIGIYCFNDAGEQGFVDVESFEYSVN
jgi:beta-xylosidase